MVFHRPTEFSDGVLIAVLTLALIDNQTIRDVVNDWFGPIFPGCHSPRWPRHVVIAHIVPISPKRGKGQSSAWSGPHR